MTVTGVIFDVVRYMWMLAKSRTSCGIAKQMDCRFCLSRQEVLWCATHPYRLERVRPLSVACLLN